MPLERLMITCGGTGGHFYPGLSIARAFRERGGEVRLLLSGINSKQQSKIAEEAGIPATVLPRMPSPKHLVQFLTGLIGGVVRARYELREFKPQALLGMGSFASFPAILAARLYRIPYFLHDGNARIGKANRILSRHSKLLATAFPPVNRAMIKTRNILVSGMPVRPELEAEVGISKEQAIIELNRRFEVNLKLELPTILIFGGSQGASVFNRIAPQALQRLGSNRFQVLHLTGPGKLAEAQGAYKGATFPRLVLSKSERMELFLGAADLVVSRSGGSTVAELALFGKTAVLIPYPYAAEDHQTDNAHYLSEASAAEVVANADFTVERASELFRDFLDSPESWQRRAYQAKQLAKPKAAEVVLDEIAKYFDLAEVKAV